MRYVARPRTDRCGAGPRALAPAAQKALGVLGRQGGRHLATFRQSPGARRYVEAAVRRSKKPLQARAVHTRNAVNGATVAGALWAAVAAAVNRLQRRPGGACQLMYDQPHGLWVLHSLGKGGLTIKGGTTVGDVFVTPSSPTEFPDSLGRTWDDLLDHESIHAHQWAALGPEMALAYGLAYLLDGELNGFERAAGLATGGYRATSPHTTG